MKKAHVIDAKDNVAVAVAAIEAGERVTIEGGQARLIEVKDDIPSGHKFALEDIEQGEPVVKYGQVIGAASRRIAKGSHVHVHNLESGRGRGDRVKREGG